ncbi:MAG: hypothetical protein RL616_579 [Verrucomicrobiota bacterium]
MNNTADNSGLISLGLINHANLNLAEMAYHASAMTALIEALKQKGVRLDEASFDNCEIVHQNENIMVLRGAAYEVVHRAFHGNEGSLAGKQMWQRNLRIYGGSHAATSLLLRSINRIKATCNSIHVIFHKRSLPN